MIGALTAGKKAVTFGYKRYGVPGAVASGGIALIGYVAVRRALRAATEADEGTLGAAIDAETLEDAIDRDGLAGVTDVATLEDAVDDDELRSAVDVADLQSDVESSISGKSDEFTDERTDARE